MAVEADSVVVELIAQNAQFDAAAKASATNFQQSMGTIQSSGAAAEGAVGQFSSALKENRLAMNQSRIGMMEFQHIARGVSDQIAAGAPLTQVLTQHIGMLGEAVALSGGAFGKLGGFLMGPWGIALTLATVVGGKLLQHFLTEKDTLDSVYDKLVKHKEQVGLNTQAEDIWSHSLDGLIERSDKLDESLKKRLQTETDLQRQTLNAAKTDFAAATAAAARLETSPNATQKQIDDAQTAIHKTALALHDAQVSAAQFAGEAIASIAKAAQVWADQQLHAIDIIQGYHPELAEKATADQMLAAYFDLKDAIDKAAAANVNFNDTVTQTNNLNNELASGTITVKTYDESIRGLAQSLRDTAEAAKNAPKAIEDFKKAVFGAEGTGPNRMGSSAAGFGQFMPSTFQHYFAQAYPDRTNLSSDQILDLRNKRDVVSGVLDVAANDYAASLKAAGQNITAASLYTVHLLSAGDPKIHSALKLLTAPGGESTSDFLSASVLSGNPFLRGTAADARAAIGKRIGGSSSAVSSGAAAIQKSIDDEAKKEAEQRAAFVSEQDRLDSDLIAARKDQVKDELVQLDLAEDAVRAEQQKRDDSYESAVTTGKLTQAQADELTAQAATVAAEKIKALEIDKQAEFARRENDALDRSYQLQVDGLKAQEAAATSQHQRRELDLVILDIVYKQKEADLEYLRLQAERNGKLDEASSLQLQIDQLPGQKERDRAQTLRGTMDPLESWLQSVPHDAEAVTEALQNIATNGFDDIASSIADVVTGSKSLGAAFNDISRQIVGDIVQMTVKMLIFRALSSAFGLGAPSTLGNFDVNIGQPALGVSTQSLSSIIAGLPHLAGGGIIRGSGGVDQNLLSLNGNPIAMVGNGEGLAVIPNNASAASPWSGGHATVLVSIEASEYFDGRVLRTTGPVIAQAATRAAQGGAGIAREDLARRQLHYLG